MAETVEIRDKEVATFAKVSSELETNIVVVAKAVTAIEKGLGRVFPQTKEASMLRYVVENEETIEDADRVDLTAFLDGGGKGAPNCGQILGILKRMGDTMHATLEDVTNAENGAIARHEGIMKQYIADVDAMTIAIEAKTRLEGGVMDGPTEDALVETLSANVKAMADLLKANKTVPQGHIEIGVCGFHNSAEFLHAHCVDCGLDTFSWCDGYRLCSGRTLGCAAPKNDVTPHTPLCNGCCLKIDSCHYCRLGKPMDWCIPKPSCLKPELSASSPWLDLH